MNSIIINGKITKGLRYASGLGDGSLSTSIGSIAKQKPYFKSAGVKQVDSWYNGTINLTITPKEFKVLKPDYVITAQWKPKTTETFWLVDVLFKHKDKSHPAYIYYPCPSEKKAHPDTLIEILTGYIDNLEYGDNAEIEVSSDRVEIIV